MDGWLERAVAGQLSVGFVAGEAGAGKTALVSEFARRAIERDPDLAVVFGDCNSQTGIGDPYLPFREILAQLTGDVEGRLAQRRLTEANAGRLRALLKASLDAVVESGPDLIGSLIPGGAILARLGGWATRDLPAAQRVRELVARRTEAVGTSALQQSHLLEQYTSVLRVLSGHRPLLLVLDDLHWVDEASAGLLFHLGRRLGAARVLIVGSYRPEEISLGRDGTRHPLEGVLSEFKRYFGDVCIELVSDTGEPGLELLQALVDLEPNRLGPAFRRALLEHTGGHPLFTLELLESLREKGQLVRDAGGAWVEGAPIEWAELPPRVEGVIEQRVGRLTAELRRLLTAASVEGEDFTAEVVARVREVEERRVVERMSGELEKRHRLVAARELRRLGGHRISLYRFRHILFRNYLYSELDPIERAYLHEAVAQALEELYADHRDQVAIQLARHWEEAGDPGRAVHYRVIAGEQAKAMFANPEAAAHFRRALELMGDAAGDDAARRTLRVRAWEGLGDVQSLSGAHEEARAAYDAGVRLLAPGEVIVRSRLLRKAANVYIRYWRQLEALQVSQAAEAALGESHAGADETMWVREWLDVLLDRGWILYAGADVAGLRALSDRIESRLIQYGTLQQRAHYFHIRFLSAIREDRYFMSPRTIEIARAGVEASQASGDTLLLQEALFFLGFALTWAGELDDGEAVLRRSLALAERGGDLHIQTQTRCYLTLVHRFRQDVDAVRMEAAALEQVANEPFYIGSARAHQAWVAWREGNLPLARELAESAMSCWHGAAWPFPWIGLWPLLGARYLLGELDGAMAAACGLIDLPMEQGGEPLKGAMPQPEPLRAVLERAVGAWRAGERNEGSTLLREAIDLARESGRL